MAAIRRFSPGLILASIAVVVVVIAVDDQPSMEPVSASRVPHVRPGSAVDASFVYLARQRSNRCDLQAKEIMSYAPNRRLQGSCCQAMDQVAYRQQRAGLKRYSGLPEVPRDPYDVSAGLAQRLLRWERSVQLNPSQTAIYKRAMGMTDEHGPCCSACWRWHAFAGLSKELIADRRWSAPQVAGLIDALDGCGGASGNGDNKGIGMGMPS